MTQVQACAPDMCVDEVVDTWGTRMDMDRHLFRRVCRHVTMYAQEDTDVQLLSSITFMGLCFEMCLDICVDVCENKCSEMNKHAHSHAHGPRASACGISRGRPPFAARARSLRYSFSIPESC